MSLWAGSQFTLSVFCVCVFFVVIFLNWSLPWGEIWDKDSRGSVRMLKWCHTVAVSALLLPCTGFVWTFVYGLMSTFACELEIIGQYRVFVRAHASACPRVFVLHHTLSLPASEHDGEDDIWKMTGTGSDCLHATSRSMRPLFLPLSFPPRHSHESRGQGEIATAV